MSDEDYYSRKSKDRSRQKILPPMHKLRLEDASHNRSSSPGYQRHYSSDRKYERSPEYSKHQSWERRMEDSSPSGNSSPSPPRRDMGDPSIPERRLIMPKQKSDLNVIQKMETDFTDGPLQSLKRCLHEYVKVMVWIRNQNGIRGICTGYVVAFDKFWNLVMKDVDEAYQKSKKPKCPYLKQNIRSDDIPEAIPNVKFDIPGTSGKKPKAEKPETAKKKDVEVIDVEVEEKENTGGPDTPKPDDREKSKKRKQSRKQRKLKMKMREVCKRNINRMFIRGDNIVLIRVCG